MTTPETTNPMRQILLGSVTAVAAIAGGMLLAQVPHRAGVHQPVIQTGSLVLLLLSLGAICWMTYQLGVWLQQRSRNSGCHLLRRTLRLAVLFATGAGAGVALFTSGGEWTILVGAPLLLLLLLALSLLAGIDRHRTDRAFGRRYGLMATAVASGFAVWAWHAFAGPGYYREYNEVRSALAALPDVEVVDIGFNRDLRLEDIWVRLRVKEHGLLEFLNVSPASFNEAGPLAVSQVGEYRVRIKRWGDFNVIDRHGNPIRSEAIGFSLNLAPGGENSPGGRLAVDGGIAVRNIPEAVAQYERLHAAMTRLASQTEGFLFEGPDGATDHFLVRAVGPDGR